MTLGGVSILMGLVTGVVDAFVIAFPSLFRKLWIAFPRNRVAGCVLSAVSVSWAAWLLWHTPLGPVEAYKQWLYLLAPLLFVLVVVFMDELLAPRALGTLMILLPAPILDIARWHPSPWRLVISGLAYVIAIKGVVLVLSPYVMRKSLERFMPDDRWCRAYGAIGLVLAAGLVVLGLTVLDGPNLVQQ